MLRLISPFIALTILFAFTTPVSADDETPADLAERVERIGRLPTELGKAKKTDPETVEALFLATLSRLPTDKEKETATKHLGTAKNREEAVRDVAWSLVNTKEFSKLQGLNKDLATSLRILHTLSEKWGKETEKEKK
jgi:hypothetical protein